MTPAALSILMTTFREGAERNKALGVWGAVGASGGTIGLLIGGVLTETVGWEWIFLLNVPVGAVVIALSPILLEETRAFGVARRFDLAGAATVTAALSLLVYALVDAGAAGWSSPQTIGLAAASALLLAAFVVIERRSAAPLVPFRIFRLPALLGSNVAGVLFGAAVFGMFFIITLYLQQVLGYSPLKAGFAWLALSVTVLVTAVGGARVGYPDRAALAPRRGPRCRCRRGLAALPHPGRCELCPQSAPGADRVRDRRRPRLRDDVDRRARRGRGTRFRPCLRTRQHHPADRRCARRRRSLHPRRLAKRGCPRRPTRSWPRQRR